MQDLSVQLRVINYLLWNSLDEKQSRRLVIDLSEGLLWSSGFVYNVRQYGLCGLHILHCPANLKFEKSRKLFWSDVNPHRLYCVLGAWPLISLVFHPFVSCFSYCPVQFTIYHSEIRELAFLFFHGLRFP